MAKKETTKDLRALDVKTLEKKSQDLNKDLLAAKKSLADQALPNPHVIGKIRRSIARVKTILNEKAKEEK